MNIYKKQMQELGLNTKQYAELINIDYAIVKDFINGKGDYNMGLKDLIRKDMLAQHQQIEEDFDNAKIKAMEIIHRTNDNEKLLNWYNNVYTPELLKDKLNINTINKFKNNYKITFNNERCSNWTYQLLIGKREYDGHHIDINKKIEFLRQLYDIIENDNGEYYLSKGNLNRNSTITKKTRKSNYNKWFKNFDIKQWKKENNIDNHKLCDILQLSYFTISNLATKKQYSQATLEKFYNYVMSLEAKQDIAETSTDEEIEILDTTDTLQDNSTSDKVDNSINQIEIDHDNNAILRMILVSRLTDEEKLLIELFGGKIC